MAIPHSFCSLFYSEVTTSRLCSGTSVASRNIRGGTVLHELTHATSGTDDIGYGCSFDQSLGQSNPREAAENADNYNVRCYFIVFSETWLLIDDGHGL